MQELENIPTEQENTNFADTSASKISNIATALALPTEPYGKIVVIKRNGQDSASFELIDDAYTFGR